MTSWCRSGMLQCTRRRSVGEREANVITEPAVHSRTITVWLTEAGTDIRSRADYLTQLDAAIGDGDHGTNMTRGFDAVSKALAGQGDDVLPGRLLILAGKTLVSTVGGASGPLWGSALRRAGRALGDAPTFDIAELAAALDAALAAIVDLGAAAPGDKTMVDAFSPAMTALHEAVNRGAPAHEALRSAAAAAEEGMRGDLPIAAPKGPAAH